MCVHPTFFCVVYIIFMRVCFASKCMCTCMWIYIYIYIYIIAYVWCVCAMIKKYSHITFSRVVSGFNVYENGFTPNHICIWNIIGVCTQVFACPCVWVCMCTKNASSEKISSSYNIPLVLNNLNQFATNQQDILLPKQRN